MTELDLDALEAVLAIEDTLSAEYMRAFDLPTMRAILAAVRAGEALREVADRMPCQFTGPALDGTGYTAHRDDCDRCMALAAYDRAIRHLMGGRE